MPNDGKHACYAVQLGHDHFRCRGCAFDGTLSEAIWHCIVNQWDVR